MSMSVCAFAYVFDVYYVVFRTYHCLLPLIASCSCIVLRRFHAFRTQTHTHSCTNTCPFIGCHFCGRLINYGFSVRSHKISSKRNTSKRQWQWKWKWRWKRDNAMLTHRYKYRKLVDWQGIHTVKPKKKAERKKHWHTNRNTYSRMKDTVKILLLAMGHWRQNAEKEHVAKDERENDKRKWKRREWKKGP